MRRRSFDCNENDYLSDEVAEWNQIVLYKGEALLNMWGTEAGMIFT